MQRLTPRQFVLLVLLTVLWGLNWPVMKLGVTGFPALTFRAASLLLSLPVLALGLKLMRLPFTIPRRDWAEVGWLSLTNMMVWHVCMILAVQSLSSGRSAILGYTMPIFSALLGAALFGERLPPRAWGGVVAAALGVGLLLWHELTNLAGRPGAVGLALFSAAVWALGTQLLRRSRLAVPTPTLAFWMTAAASVVVAGLAALFEHARWAPPSPAVAWAIAYNALLIFGLAQVFWMALARELPPIASTLSVMAIPVLGVFSGAVGLGEVLHWQDWTAVGLVMVAIASVLAPSRR